MGSLFVIQVEETTLKQMLANLVIAKKAAAATATAEAKARKEKDKEKAKNANANKNKNQDQDQNSPWPDSGLPETERTDAKLAADDEWAEQRGEGGREGEGETRGTGGQDERGSRR